MRSSTDSEGFKLLSKLKTKSGSAPIPLRITFSGILIPVEFSGVGSIAEFSERRLRVSGSDFDISFDLNEAVFGPTASAETLRGVGADPVLCGEADRDRLRVG